jgi:hypothetical protein
MKRDRRMITAPVTYSHQESRLSRGKATSRAPISRGMKIFPKATGIPG